MNINWVFPSSNGGSDDGFNDAGIETFTGARFDGLAREIIQNSLDAAIDDQVVVEFAFVSIAREDFPGRDALLGVIEQCQKESSDDKGKTFFGNAVKVLKKPKIPCLKISDSGTTGLQGDYRKRKGQWHAITKARGVSSDKKPGAAGSFGIGKNAPFTVSSVRTVFYSTRYEDQGNTVYRAQGKSILMSHSIDKGGYTQAVGFYGGTEECMPLEGKDNIPSILLPQEQGCVVFVPGFSTEKQWQHKIMTTVVVNFFYAIDQGKLVVVIQDDNKDSKKIEKENLEECFQQIEELGITPGKVTNSRHYYRVMKSPQSSSKESQLSRLGHCNMKILTEEGLPKRVALLRKTGMLITDDQLHLKRWSGRMDFAGVFICEGDEGNELLRKMENPQHNAFEPERPVSDADKEKCKKALDQLVKWVKGNVDELAKPEESEITQIDELHEFFPDQDPPETIPGDEGERDPEGLPKYSPKPLVKILPNKTFPHPVLWKNTNDYTSRQFQATRNFCVNEHKAPVLEFDFALSEESIIDLVAQKKATYILEVYCPTTFVRRIFNTREKAGEFTLAEGDLYRRVEINAFVVCTEEIHEYASRNFNSEFGDSSFRLLPGDVLAAADAVIFYWDTECVAPLHSVFDLVSNNNVKIGTFEVDTENDKIKIQMNPTDKIRFDSMRQATELKSYTMFVYFSVVAEVLRQVKEFSNDDGKDRKWYRAIEHKLLEMGENVSPSLDPFKLAQKLLRNPLGMVLPQPDAGD